MTPQELKRKPIYLVVDIHKSLNLVHCHQQSFNLDVLNVEGVSTTYPAADDRELLTVKEK